MTSMIVVDDERSFANFVVKVAQSVNIDATISDCATDFLTATKRDWPTIVVVDLQMPDGDGIELLREMAERHCTSKIVIASGMDGRVLDSACRLGVEFGLAMAGQLAKPIRVAELKNLLTSLIPSAAAVTVASLDAALNADNLFMLYQPQIDLETNRIMGVEALVRWRMPDGQIIPPDSFIPIAEESGLIDRLTSFVVETAFRQASAWRRRGLDLQLAVNLSAVNMQDRTLPDRLAAQCAAAELSPNGITLELTETASTRDHAILLEVLGRLRLKGFRLSIDDFGTGYSSVAQLLRLPFTELKIDKSFVVGMDLARESAVVTKTLIDMAHNLGLSTVAEGVEAAGVMRSLCEWSCQTAQGYLFSKPVDAAIIERIAAKPRVHQSDES